MLDPKDIYSTREDADEFNATRIRVGLKLTTERLVNRQMHVEREEQRAKAEVWHHFYGDTLRDLDEVERAIMPLLGMGGYRVAEIAFGKLRAKLANPFLTPPVPAG